MRFPIPERFTSETTIEPPDELPTVNPMLLAMPLEIQVTERLERLEEELEKLHRKLEEVTWYVNLLSSGYSFLDR